jgi:hypothetical protein
MLGPEKQLIPYWPESIDFSAEISVRLKRIGCINKEDRGFFSDFQIYRFPINGLIDGSIFLALSEQQEDHRSMAIEMCNILIGNCLTTWSDKNDHFLTLKAPERVGQGLDLEMDERPLLVEYTLCDQGHERSLYLLDQTQFLQQYDFTRLVPNKVRSVTNVHLT